MKNTFLLLTSASLMMINAHASTILFDSSAANTTNNSGHATMNIPQHPVWAPALAGSNWISFGMTGNPNSTGYFVVPNGTTVTFTQTFTLDSPVVAASLSVMADDTSSVVINGLTVYAATSPVNGYPTCSSQPIGCLAATRKAFSTSDLQSFWKLGTNTLSFGVEQKGLVSFGLDYAGSVTTAAPEPASFGLIGAGLLGLGFLSRRIRPSL